MMRPAAVLRVCALPIRMWTAAANPELFAQLRKGAADEAVERERVRLADLGWQLVRSSEFATRALPEMVADIERRLAAGETWTGKRLRQRAEYLLRMIARGATKPTPRDWLAHLALVGIDSDATSWPTVGECAIQHATNINADRRSARLDDATITMTGLHWTDGDRLRCWVADRDSMRQVAIRRTPLLDAVCNVLADGVRDADEIVRRLAPDSGDVLRGFLHHLADIGVLQLSKPPRVVLSDWGRPTAPVRGGFTDVYRRADGAVPAEFVDWIRRLSLQANRLSALVPQPADHPVVSRIGSAPRPVTDLVAEHLENPFQAVRRPLRALDLPSPLTPRVLDGLGAPPATVPDWPLDVLVRPMTKGAVLEAIAPAGAIDARFADALSRLHGELPQVTAYRKFLTEHSARHDVAPIEILVPPLDDRAANAVRRPFYCPLWTGDADSTGYQPSGGRYVPLDRITLRRDGNRIIAEERNGTELWPMYHATRSPVGPWELVIALLTAATPRPRSLSFGNRLHAFPDRNHLPRLEIAGGLVLAGAQWRIKTPSTPRELAMLRLGTDIPRWVFARAATGQARPVDLESLTALKVLARMGAQELIVEEMLPDPEHLPLRDAVGEPVAGQLLFRLPHHRATTAAAVANKEGDNGWDRFWNSPNWTA